MFESVLYAAAPAQTPSGAIGSLFPLFLIFLIFYFLLIRPQQKQMKEHQKMLKSLKKGDNVITSGGIIGTITEIGEKEITLKISENCRARFTKNSVTAVLNRKPNA
ncbi:MAG: preprotein translocase subunit YajC [Elusimicrobia bacterium]|nr:preprotein translocase subunit YajC [Elusimicrobiota bacterium]